MKNDKWVKQWFVESESGPGGYVVSLDKDGNYACGCPGWTRNVLRVCPTCGKPCFKASDNWVCPLHDVEPVTQRRDCKHIRTVQGGGGRTTTEAVIDRMKGKI